MNRPKVGQLLRAKGPEVGQLLRTKEEIEIWVGDRCLVLDVGELFLVLRVTEHTVTKAQNTRSAAATWRNWGATILTSKGIIADWCRWSPWKPVGSPECNDNVELVEP